MGCTVPNIVACALLGVSLLFVLISLDPKKAGGYMNLKLVDTTSDKTEYFAHPLYMSIVKNTAGETPEADDAQCAALTAADASNSGGFNDFGENSCSASIIRATRMPESNQQAYAASMLGGANGYLRRWWKADAVATGDDVDAMMNTVFSLAQASACFLCFGIICHLLAFAFGGFIWDFTKGCNFGLCAILFNSIYYAGLSVLCYIISLCTFAGIYMQGQEVTTDAPVTGTTVVGEPDGEKSYSPGGALVITATLFNVIAITLASWQWYQDSKKEEKPNDLQQVQVQG